MRFRLLNELATPMAVALNAIPIIVLVSLFINMYPATSEMPRRLMVTLIVFFIVLVNVAKGLRQVHPIHVELMRSYAASPVQVLRKARIPNAVPYLFTALKIAAPTSVITAFVAEYFGGNQNGLGSRITSNVAIAQERRGVGVRGRRLRGRSNVLPGLRGTGEHHNTQTGRQPRGRINMTSRRNVRRIAGAIAALSLVAAACGDDDDDDAATTAAGHCVGDRGTGGHHRRARHRGTGGNDRAGGDGGAPADDGCGGLRIGGRVRHARAGEAAAAMVRAVAVRRLLRSQRPGLLRRHVHRPRDPRGRRRDRAADAARQRRRRLRDRMGAQGARQPRSRRQHRRHRPDLPALGHVAGVVQGQGHHHARPTSPARRSATGASATSTRSSPPSGRPVSIPHPTSRWSPRTSTWSVCSTAASMPPRR